jgi:hypothetical protein
MYGANMYWRGFVLGRKIDDKYIANLPSALLHAQQLGEALKSFVHLIFSTACIYRYLVPAGRHKISDLVYLRSCPASNDVRPIMCNIWGIRALLMAIILICVSLRITSMERLYVGSVFACVWADYVVELNDTVLCQILKEFSYIHMPRAGPEQFGKKAIDNLLTSGFLAQAETYTFPPQNHSLRSTAETRKVPKARLSEPSTKQSSLPLRAYLQTWGVA